MNPWKNLCTTTHETCKTEIDYVNLSINVLVEPETKSGATDCRTCESCDWLDYHRIIDWQFLDSNTFVTTPAG